MKDAVMDWLLDRPWLTIPLYLCFCIGVAALWVEFAKPWLEMSE